MTEHMKSILVVEDEKDLNDLICVELEDAGYRTIPAYNGKQSIELAGENYPDLILLDVCLPDISGIHVSEEINNDEVLKKIPIIFLTSKSDLQTKLLSYISGAKRYITKPFDPDYLIDQIQRLTDHALGYPEAGRHGESYYPDITGN